MAYQLAPLIRRMPTPQPARRAAIIGASGSAAIIDADVARRLGQPAVRRPSWLANPDLRDAAVAFALTFTGAMIFLL